MTSATDAAVRVRVVAGAWQRWLNVDPVILPTVAAVTNRVCQLAHWGKSSKAVALTIDGAVLPSIESASIFREGDIVEVSMSQTTPPSSASQIATTPPTVNVDGAVIVDMGNSSSSGGEHWPPSGPKDQIAIGEEEITATLSSNSSSTAKRRRHKKRRSGAARRASKRTRQRSALLKATSEYSSNLGDSSSIGSKSSSKSSNSRGAGEQTNGSTRSNPERWPPWAANEVLLETGTVVAYRVLELSPLAQPEWSAFRVGRLAETLGSSTIALIEEEEEEEKKESIDEEEEEKEGEEKEGEEKKKNREYSRADLATDAAITPFTTRPTGKYGLAGGLSRFLFSGHDRNPTEEAEAVAETEAETEAAEAEAEAEKAKATKARHHIFHKRVYPLAQLRDIRIDPESLPKTNKTKRNTKISGREA